MKFFSIKNYRAADSKAAGAAVSLDKSTAANDPIFEPDNPSAPASGSTERSRIRIALPRRASGLTAAAALCLCLSGCELNTFGQASSEPAFDYGAAVNCFIPELKRHTAFGSDVLQLKSLNQHEDPRLLQAAASALRLNGASVALVDDEKAAALNNTKEMRELAAAQQAGLAPVHERTLWVKKDINGETLLLTLALDDTVMYCSFINFQGELVPSSALSIARGAVYGS